MKKILFAVLFLALLVGQCWGADYYVNSNTGSDTYDGTSATYVSGTTGPKATISAGAALMTGSGNTLHVANGTYQETANIVWPGTGSNTITGESRDGVIVDLTNKTTGSWIQTSGSNDDSGTIENITVKNLVITDAYLFQISGADNFTLRNIKAKDNERLFNVITASENFTIEYFESSGIRSATRAATFNSGQVITINYSIFRASENYLQSVYQIYNAATTVNINRSYFSGSKTAALIQLIDAATVTAKNSIFVGNGNSGDFGGYHISGSCANVALTSCYATNNWLYNMDSEILSGFTDDAPYLNSHTRYGIILLAVDDTGNWDYAKLMASVANARGYHITFYVLTVNLPAVGIGGEYAGLPLSELKTFLDAGNYIGCHSENHPTDITVDADNLPTSGLWDTEITGAKAKLEAYIQQISGYESWTCDIWASPGNGGSSDLADRIKTDGFEYGRMGNVNEADSYLLQNHAIFTVKPIPSSFVKTAQLESTISTDNIAQLCEHLEAIGGVGGLYLHANDETYYDPDEDGLNSMFDEFEKHNVILMNAKEYLAWLVSNATYSDGAGNAARWSVSFSVDSFNGELRSTSGCIDGGANDDNLYGEVDFGGKPQYGKNDIGPYERQPKTPQFIGLYPFSGPGMH